MRAQNLSIAVAALLALSSQTLAQTPDEFYKGKTVEVYVGTSPGGGYDLYGRIIARNMGAHIPGKPAVIVKNMPGAGHLKMTNWVFNAAPRNGTVLGVARASGGD